MEQTTRAFLVGVTGVLGAVALLGLTVYPFRYGVVESSVLVGLVVLVALFEFVLDETTF